MNSEQELVDLLKSLDEDLASGLRLALEDNPESLRLYLAEQGYIEMLETHGEPEITAAEEALLDVLEDLGNPKSTGEIQEIIEIEYPQKLEEYNSFKHRPWISDKLNSLSKKGFLGKYREGREVKFTAEPAEAVRRWALHNNKFASELTRGNAEEIATDTGMNLRAVRNAIDEISNEA